MGSQWTNDSVYRKAMRAGYRARAAYKLLEIQRRHGIIRPDDNVVDLGAAPGSWLQVLRDLTDAKVIGVDLNPIAPLEGVTTIVGDFTDPAFRSASARRLAASSTLWSLMPPRNSPARRVMTRPVRLALARMLWRLRAQF